ncbi:MAG: fumarylacetoacetate hydrolase family protein [Bryobacteraceae bacterium]|jgi:2-keto-4-pentenoate hydratase/2-oxohepta-3-ene-1,7-dioic acid hydratase in catechol pathway
MRFVTFEHTGHRHAGVVSKETVVSLKTAGFPDLLSVLQGGTEASRKVESFISKPPADAIFPLASVKLCAPIPKPPKILCMGLNYRDHAAEAKMELPKVPIIFAKYANTVIGPGDNIVLPKSSSKPDYEAELGFVIGKGGRYIKAENWRQHVFGYMNCNDVSARDYQLAVSQWTMGKNFDTFLPMGPWLVSADEIEDPHNLNISTTLNGEKLQNSNTRELIFKIPETIEFLSSVMTLEPGDIVLTGTPSGVGFSHKPPKWLTPGAEVVVRVEGLGELRNTCVAEV